MSGNGLTRHGRRQARLHLVFVTIAFALFWVPVIIFANLADEVIEREQLPFDSAILEFAHAEHSPLMNNIFLFFTSLGEPLSVAGAGAIILLIALWRRRYRAVGLVLAGLGGAVLANLFLKFVFARSRPTEFAALITEKSYSFPSGHAMVSAAFVGVVIILAWHTKYRISVIVVGVLATLAIGFSRVYLGVHYPSDVLAGWSLGVVWAAIVGSLVMNRPFAIGHRLSRFFHRTV